MMKSNGVHLHYRVEGPEDGQSVVFVNSLGTDFRVFDALVPLLKGKLRIVRYDKRGHGLSDATPRPYRMDDHIADLAAFLDQLAIRQAVVVGLSIGGQIALGLSARRPDLLRAIVFMDSAHKIATPEIWATRLEAVETLGVAGIADATLQRWFSPRFRTTRTAELAGWRNMLVRTTVDGYAGSGAAIGDTDYEAAARAVQVPVLGIGGAFDGSTPPEAVKATIALIPKGRFVLIESAGHLPCVEDPVAVAAAMNEFFGENGIG